MAGNGSDVEEGPVQPVDWVTSFGLQNVKIAGAVAFYFIVSLSLVFINKTLFTTYNLPFPIFISWWQFVVSFFMIVLCYNVGEWIPSLRLIPAPELHASKARIVAPVTSVFIAMMVFNNLCLKYVEVSFYQVARSLTIAFSILFTWLFLGQATSRKAVAACGVVILGFALGSLGEVHFSPVGLVFGVCSSAFVALYGIVVKRALNALDGNSWKLMVYNTELSIFFMIPIVFLLGEHEAVVSDPRLYEPYIWIAMSISGVFGFLIGIANFLQISLTSPLTHNISGTAKACVQTVLSVIVYHNPISSMNALGIGFVIGGSAWYSVIRRSAMASSK